jgi:hypothetical protein
MPEIGTSFRIYPFSFTRSSILSYINGTYGVGIVRHNWPIAWVQSDVRIFPPPNSGLHACLAFPIAG